MDAEEEGVGAEEAGYSVAGVTQDLAPEKDTAEAGVEVAAVEAKLEINQDLYLKEELSVFTLQLGQQKELQDHLHHLRREMVDMRMKQIAYMALNMVLDKLSAPATSCIP